jgi:phytol kinase
MSAVHRMIAFFIANTPPWHVIATAGPLWMLWAALCLGFAARCKRRYGLRTGYSRKIFHFLIFATAALVQWRWGTPMVCLFGGMTTLVVFYAVWRGAGHPLYEAMARESDAPHRTYFIMAPYFATLIGGLGANMLFGRAALVGYLVTGFGDAIGEPVGTRFGTHRYRVPSLFGVPAERSLEGSAAVFVACWVAVAVGVGLCPGLALPAHPMAVYPAFAALCAVTEAMAPHGWDNALLQLAPAAMAVAWFG